MNTLYGLFINDISELSEFLSKNCFLKDVLKDAEHFYLDYCTVYCGEEPKSNLKTILDSCENKTFFGKVVAYGYSNKAFAFKVEFPNLPIQNPYITVCTFNNGRPSDSKKIESWIYMLDPISISAELTKVF